MNIQIDNVIASQFFMYFVYKILSKHYSSFIQSGYKAIFASHVAEIWDFRHFCEQNNLSYNSIVMDRSWILWIHTNLISGLMTF